MQESELSSDSYFLVPILCFYQSYQLLTNLSRINSRHDESELEILLAALEYLRYRLPHAEHIHTKKTARNGLA